MSKSWSDFESEDFQKRGDRAPISGKPDSIVVYDHLPVKFAELHFKNTDEKTAEQWARTFALQNQLPCEKVNTYQVGDYPNDWVDAVVSWA